MEVFKKFMNKIVRVSNKEQKERSVSMIDQKFGFVHYIYLTDEGLPIFGTYANLEETAAKLLNLFKNLQNTIPPENGWYIIDQGGTKLVIIRISDEVIFAGETLQKVSPATIRQIRRISVECL